MFRTLLTAVALLTAVPLTALAQDAAGGLTVHQPWARATSGVAKTGAAYMTLTNDGAVADHLVAADTPVAKRAELHTHLAEDGIMKMRPVDAVEVAPGTPMVLQPGGLHVMLMGLKRPLEAGTAFPLTLVFERAGRVTVEVRVGSGVVKGHGGHKMN